MMETRDTIYIALFLITIMSVGVNIGIMLQRIKGIANNQNRIEEKVGKLEEGLYTKVNQHSSSLAAIEQRCHDHSKQITRLVDALDRGAGTP